MEYDFYKNIVGETEQNMLLKYKENQSINWNQIQVQEKHSIYFSWKTQIRNATIIKHISLSNGKIQLSQYFFSFSLAELLNMLAKVYSKSLLPIDHINNLIQL